MKRELTRVHRFEKDIRLNPFGDYDLLKLHAVDEKGDGNVVRTWSLTSSRGADEDVLNEADVRHALEHIFVQGSQMVTPT